MKGLPSSLCVALGSGLGGGLRYTLDSVVLLLGIPALPLATLFVNLSGSLLVGFLAGRWTVGAGSTAGRSHWHFWITGFCGGYTTFSTFSWQVLDLVRSGEGTLAGAYAAGSIALGVVAVGFGLSMAQRNRNNGASRGV